MARGNWWCIHSATIRRIAKQDATTASSCCSNCVSCQMGAFRRRGGPAAVGGRILLSIKSLLSNGTAFSVHCVLTLGRADLADVVVPPRVSKSDDAGPSATKACLARGRCRLGNNNADDSWVFSPLLVSTAVPTIVPLPPAHTPFPTPVVVSGLCCCGSSCCCCSFLENDE